MSTNKVAVKHIILFIPGVLHFQVEGFDEKEAFPNLADKLLNGDMNAVKQFLEKHFLQQGFKQFIETAKINFGIGEGEKLTPQMWSDAVTSYRAARGSVSLLIEETDSKRSYTAALNLANTVVAFAKQLEPDHFANADSMEDFIALLPAAPEEVQAAVETAQENTAATAEAPEQVAEIATPAPTAPTAEVPVENLPAAAPVETGVAQVGLKMVIEAFDRQDATLALAEERFEDLAAGINAAKKATIGEIRAANQQVRGAMLQAITGEMPTEVPTLEEAAKS